MNTQALSSLLSKEVSRKEFLIYLGLFLLTITGISHVLKTIKDPELLGASKPTKGFGSGVYGR